MMPNMKKALILLPAVLFSVMFLISCDARLNVDDVTELSAGSDEIVSVDAGKTKVIVLSGQSNAAGVAFSDTLTEEEQARYAAGFPDVRIYVVNAVSGNDSDGFVSAATGWGDSTDKSLFGPEVGLSEQLEASYPGEKVYIIKYSWSGAGLEDLFLPGKAGFTGLCNAIDTGLSELRDMGLDPEVVAFCWMQGETDAVSRGTALRYGDNQRTMVESLRSLYGRFFFIDAGISPTWKYYTRVNTAKRDMDCSLERCVFINSNLHGLVVSRTDAAHYDAPSMLELGHLFGEQVAGHIVTGE